MRVRGGAAAAAVLVALVVGLVGGAFLDQEFPGEVPPLTPGRTSGSLDRGSFAEAVQVIQAHYYSTQIDYSKLSQGSISGLVNSLGDPFSRYLTPSQYKRQLQEYAGQLSGIGIYVDLRNRYPLISSVIVGGPADRAGLKAGDRILAVDGHSAAGGGTAVTNRIEGAAGTPVTLTIGRGSAKLTVRVIRAKITVPSVASWHFPNGVLYLRVYAFQDTTAKEFSSELRGGLLARGIILDLRDNPGGFVAAARAVVSQFLRRGEVFSLRGRSGTETQSVTGSHMAPTVPLVVLVNRGTASAAEITAGALKTRGRARLVGQRTYGKGEVEEDFPLRGGGDIHLTVEHWFLPNGQTVQGKGLQPDLSVSLASPSDMFSVVEPSLGHAKDAQLNRALALLGSG